MAFSRVFDSSAVQRTLIVKLARQALWRAMRQAETEAEYHAAVCMQRMARWKLAKRKVAARGGRGGEGSQIRRGLWSNWISPDAFQVPSKC